MPTKSNRQRVLATLNYLGTYGWDVIDLSSPFTSTGIAKSTTWLLGPRACLQRCTPRPTMTRAWKAGKQTDFGGYTVSVIDVDLLRGYSIQSMSMRRRFLIVWPPRSSEINSLASRHRTILATARLFSPDTCTPNRQRAIKLLAKCGLSQTICELQHSFEDEVFEGREMPDRIDAWYARFKVFA